MAGIEILGNENDPIQESRTRTANIDRGEERGIEITGPMELVESIYDADLLTLGTDPDKTQLDFRTQRGRATYRISNARTIAGGFVDPETGGLQELVAVDVLRPWYTAPYFQSLGTAEIAKTRRAVEDGVEDPVGVLSGTLSYQLFAHMIRGDNYYETAYLLRRTFRTNSNQTILLAAANINKVVDLPALSQRLQNLIDALPAGEWLKRPVQCRFLGRDGWDVSDEYLWAPQWSVVYGGTFDGGYPSD
jgi:hypothetical protein